LIKGSKDPDLKEWKLERNTSI